MEISRPGPGSVVRLIGSVGMSEAESLRETLLELAQPGQQPLVVDLRETDFLSSMGLGALISAHQACRRHGGAVRLVRPSAEICQLLETTRLNKLFAVCDSVDEAMDSLDK